MAVDAQILYVSERNEGRDEREGWRKKEIPL